MPTNRANPYITSSIGDAHDEAAWLRDRGLSVEVLFVDQHPAVPAGWPVWEVWSYEAAA